MPKSATLACCCSSRRMFAVLMSRWRMPCECRYARPEATSSAMQPFLAGSSGRLFLPCSSECSEPPCMNSSTIAGRPSCMTVPMNAQMCGWRSLRQISTSDMKHFKESLPMLGSSLSTFTATVATPQLASHTLLSLPSAQKRVSVRSANCFSCHSSLCVESHGQFNAVDSPCDCDVSPSEPTGVVIADLGGVSSVTGRVSCSMIFLSRVSNVAT
mmetsp:Transcript_13453/g.29108  ORF Transcript_13453/g.29108 Transcript_13453/m.29108 type:complete len:214 (+) Transcript_13453:842-1483(+)